MRGEIFAGSKSFHFDLQFYYFVQSTETTFAGMIHSVDLP